MSSISVNDTFQVKEFVSLSWSTDNFSYEALEIKADDNLSICLYQDLPTLIQIAFFPPHLSLPFVTVCEWHQSKLILSVLCGDRKRTNCVF